MGLFSKLKKVLKKTIRGVGKIIKKVTKPFRKVLRKVLKPIGRVVNKLGFVGTLALGFILPGAGAWIGNWLSGFGPKMASLVSNISSGFQAVMKPFKTVYNSVTEVFKQGINRVGQMFGFEGPAGMKWGGYGEGLVADASVDPLTGAITGGSTEGTLTDWVSSIIGPKKPKVDATETPVVDVPTVETPSLMSPTSQKELNMLGQEEAFSQTTAKGLDIIRKGDIVDGKTITGFTGENTFTPPTEVPSETWWERNVIGDDSFVQRIGDTKIGNFATVREVGKGARAAASGYGTYMAFAGGADYEPGFYNPNIGDAQGFLQESAMYSQTPMDDLYFSGDMGTPQDTFTSLANKYLNAFGQVVPQGTDPFMFAQQMPGYGYNFNSYVEDSFGGLYG